MGERDRDTNRERGAGRRREWEERPKESVSKGGVASLFCESGRGSSAESTREQHYLG